MTFRTILALPFVALTLGGCSSGGSGGGGTVAPGATLIRAEEAIEWDAETYTATPVDGKVTVAIQNDSSLPHNLHLLDSTNVDQGVALTVEGRGDLRSATVTLAPGTYQVICTIPGHGNMKASLTVS